MRRTTIFRLTLLGLALVALACTSYHGFGTLDGTDSFKVGSAFQLSIKRPDGTADLSFLSVVLLQQEYTCDELLALENNTGSSASAGGVMLATMFKQDGFSPGTYDVSDTTLPDGGTAPVDLLAFVPLRESFTAGSGTFQIHRVDDTGMSASFQVTGEGDAGTLSGSFDAVNCFLNPDGGL